ncbi:hypothetical protein MRX96_009542 [Rhipicephalus microplus]
METAPAQLFFFFLSKFEPASPDLHPPRAPGFAKEGVLQHAEAKRRKKRTEALAACQVPQAGVRARLNSLASSSKPAGPRWFFCRGLALCLAARVGNADRRPEISGAR